MSISMSAKLYFKQLCSFPGPEGTWIVGVPFHRRGGSAQLYPAGQGLSPPVLDDTGADHHQFYVLSVSARSDVNLHRSMVSASERS